MSVILPDSSTCLNNIIGLTRSECDCYTVAENTSDSGLYLDEAEGLNLVQIDSAADCNTGDLSDLLLKAKEAAIKAFQTDLPAKLSEYYQAARKPFKGVIGRPDMTANTTVSGVAGIELFCAPVKNGIMKISRLGLAFSETGTMDVSVYDNLSDEPIITYTGLSTLANKVKWNTLDTPLELPLYSVEQTYVRYFIVYTYTGNAPKNTTIKCGCSSEIRAISFNSHTPVFRQKMNDERFTWAMWVMATGVKAADIDTIRSRTYTSITDLNYGVLVDGEIKCSAAGITCNDVDYENSNEAIVKAYAVRFKAAELLVNQILSSGNLSRFTMLDREALYGKRNQYRKEYSDRIEWLAVNMDWQSTGCYSCNNQLNKASLL